RRYEIAQPNGGSLGTLLEVWVASADGSVTREVTTDETVQRDSPRWSPDCLKLVYERYTPTGLDIGTVNANGTGESLVTTDGFSTEEVQPTWQPLVGGGPVACAPIAPSSAPASPSTVVAAAGNGSATVSWAAPQNGGSPITSYRVTPSTGAP